jgi:hypothetical protein
MPLEDVSAEWAKPLLVDVRADSWLDRDDIVVEPLFYGMMGR